MHHVRCAFVSTASLFSSNALLMFPVFSKAKLVIKIIIFHNFFINSS